MADTALAEALAIESVRLSLGFGQEHGPESARDLRRALWVADIRSSILEHEARGRVEALVAGLDGGIGGFLLWNPARAYPLADPTGSIVGAATVKIKAVGADGLSFSLKGLPASYILQRGDMVQVDTGSPAHRGLHRISEPAAIVADGAGETDLFAVRPAVHPGMAANDAVNLKRSAAEFRIVPGSYDPQAAKVTGTVSFLARQRT